MCLALRDVFLNRKDVCCALKDREALENRKVEGHLRQT